MCVCVCMSIVSCTSHTSGWSRWFLLEYLRRPPVQSLTLMRKKQHLSRLFFSVCCCLAHTDRLLSFQITFLQYWGSMHKFRMTAAARAGQHIRMNKAEQRYLLFCSVSTQSCPTDIPGLRDDGMSVLPRGSPLCLRAPWTWFDEASL